MKPGFWTFFAGSVAAVGLSAWITLWFVGRAQSEPLAEAERIRTEEVIAQDRLLVDAIWSALETLKTRALSLQAVRREQLRVGAPPAAPQGPILHWAELDLSAGALQGVRQAARNPEWKPGGDPAGFEAYYLKAALERLKARDLTDNGVALLRLKRDPAHGAEWLALAFPANPAGSGAVLALVDPAEAFPIFRRWTSRSEGGKLRGYLVGEDGFVLAHSQKPYVSSSFASTQVFRDGVRALLNGSQVSGAGVFRGIDGLPVAVAYARPGTLPIAAVVERVAPEPETLSQAPLAVVMRLPKEAAQAALALGLLCLLSAGAIRWVVPTGEWGGEKGAVLGLELRPEPAVELGPDPRDELPRSVAGPAGAVRRDPLRPAQRLADMASGLMGGPTLFFGYDAGRGMAVLQAGAGFPDGRGMEQSLPSGLSFPLSEPMRNRIARYHEAGKTASLADDPGLALLLARRLGNPRCDAWPVVAADGRLLGILVAPGLDPSQSPQVSASRSTKIESLGKIVRTLDV